MSLMKECNKCHITKELTEYTINRKHKDGLQNFCKSCFREYRRKWDKTKGGKASTRKWEYSRKGVYGIFENEQCLYVGESRRVNKRLNCHKSIINNPSIAPPTSKKLYNQLSQHTCLEFKILEETPNHKEQEQYWINQLKPKYNAYKVQ